MAVQRLAYGKALEKESRKKQSLTQMQKRVARQSLIDEYDRPSALDKFILKRLKARKARKLKRKKKSVETTRTKVVTTGLKRAGLSEAEIRRLKGK